ncbi:MAG: AMP-binding protein [Bacteroidales bacterium]
MRKINCPLVEGMVMIEDLMAGVTTGDKLKAALKTKLPLGMLLKMVSGGSEDDTAAMLFTSGSEKDPKAVPLSHRNLVANIESFSSYVGISGKGQVACQSCILPYFRPHC